MRQEFKEEIYKEFLNKRNIILNGEIDDNVIETIVMQIYKFNEEDDKKEKEEVNYRRYNSPINIYINSNGGNIYNLLSVVSAIDSSKTPIHTFALGKAMSAGFIILISGHKRYCQKYSIILIHQSSTGIRGLLSNIELELKQAKYLEQIVDKITTDKTNITFDQLKDIYEKRLDWYIGAKEALELGIVDEII
jgi:ATP-dependent Clp protease protease subunit